MKALPERSSDTRFGTSDAPYSTSLIWPASMQIPRGEQPCVLSLHPRHMRPGAQKILIVWKRHVFTSFAVNLIFYVNVCSLGWDGAGAVICSPC